MTAWRFWESRNARIAREAAEWRVEMLEPSSPETRRDFALWRAADPDHARAYAELGPFAGLATQLPRPERSAPRAGNRLRPAFAAAFAILLIMAGVLVLSGRASSPAFASVTNAGPAVRVVRLSDGTTIVLDPGAALSVRIGAQGGEARLRHGRARFNLAASTSRPFAIHAGNAVVRSQQGLVDVALEGGRARVDALRGPAVVASDDGAGVTLSPGAAAIVDRQAVQPIAVTRGQRLWPAARVGFDGARLADVVATADRFGKPPIRLVGTGLGARRVTGVLDLRDGNALAAKLAATLDLRVDHAPDAIILTR